MFKTVTRRALISATGALASSVVIPVPIARARPGGPTFVLVHGAWRGGWVWERVAEALRAAGAKVYAPTLTGLAERSHLLSEAITLKTHIDDVVGELK